MWILIAIVVVAIVLIVFVGRQSEDAVSRDVAAVSSRGLHLAADDLPIGQSKVDDQMIVPWSSIFEITVTTRRGLKRTWFGFEIRTEGHGMVVVDSSAGLGEAFLAESHRLSGFDHERLGEALTQAGSRAVCYVR